MSTTSTIAARGPVDDLQKELDRKKQEKAADDGKGLGDQIKDLEKLVQVATRANDGYAKKYEDLKKEQLRLETFGKNTEPDLVEIIGEAGIAAVKDAVKDKIDAIAAKRTEVAELRGVIPVREEDKAKFAIGAVTVAEVDLADKVAKHLAAKATLAIYSDLAGAVGARLDWLGKVEKDILKRGQGGQPATAFWLMTRGEPTAAPAPAGAVTPPPVEATDESLAAPPPPDPDAAAAAAEAEAAWQALLEALLPKALFFNGGLAAPPAIIRPDELVGKLAEAWGKEKEAAGAVEDAKKLLADNAGALKDAEKALADLEKGLFQAITDAAAEWDKNRVNPDS